VITQIQTECIELAAFLNKIQVMSFSTSVCSCSQARKTAVHVIVHCERFAGCRERLQDPCTEMLNIKALVEKPEQVQLLARWFIQLGLLKQFTLASQLLYGEDGKDGVYEETVED